MCQGEASTFFGCGEGKSLHPGGPGHRLANRKGPVKAENAVRKTGLLTGGRKPGDTTGPVCQRLKSKGCNVTCEGQLPPRPLDCGLGLLPHGVVDLPASAPPSNVGWLS